MPYGPICSLSYTRHINEHRLVKTVLIKVIFFYSSIKLYLIVAPPALVKVTSQSTALYYNQHQVVWEVPENGGEPISEYVVYWRQVSYVHTLIH